MELAATVVNGLLGLMASQPRAGCHRGRAAAGGLRDGQCYREGEGGPCVEGDAEALRD